MDKFETSDISQTTYLKRLGFDYEIRRIGKKCFFLFPPEAVKEINKFNEIRVSVYDDIFENNKK